MKKTIKLTSIFLLLSLFLFVFVAGYFYFSTRNIQTGRLHLSGLKGPVTIKRDQWGVVHIRATVSDEDAYFALGYAHARDRFWQMEFQRRVAQGTLSEVLGKAALEKDIFLRTWGFYRAAQTEWDALSPRTKSIVNAYTAGVNAFLQTGRLPMPFKILRYQPKPWTITDSLVWGKMMAFNLQGYWSQKITNYLMVKQYGKNALSELRPPYPKNHPTILSKADLVQSHLRLNKDRQVNRVARQVGTRTEKALLTLKTDSDRIKTSLGFQDSPGKGSDNWVVSGKYTKSGLPLLANDPHLHLNSPGVWYLADVQGPGFHVVGASLPGLPAVVIGHNDHISWGITNVNPDTSDLYVEPKNTEYKVLHEVIKVKGAPDYHLDVKVSQHGPVINGLADAKKMDRNIALKWTALQPKDRSIEAMLEMNRAKDWKTFTKALRYYSGPSQNFVYADVQGNIGYYLPGDVPIRPEYCDTRFPIEPGQKCEWKGFIPFDQMPHVYNPQKGFIASANNKAMPNSYHYARYFPHPFPGFRAKRINDLIMGMIDRHHPIIADDFQTMQMDIQNNYWHEVKAYLLNTKPLDDRSQKALSVLKQWNGKMGLKQAAPTIFAAWYEALLKVMPPEKTSFNSEHNKSLFLLEQLKNNGKYCRVAPFQNCGELKSRLLQKAMLRLSEQYGTQEPKKWLWENVHQASFIESALGQAKPIGWIWNRHLAVPGGNYTLDMGSYDENLHFSLAPSYRQIVDLSNWNNSRYIAPPGQIDDPFSKHSDDFIKPWRDGKYIPMSFDHIQRFSSEEILTLTPNE